MLPLNNSSIKKVAFIGPNADTYNAGGRSALVDLFHVVKAYAGLKALAKNMKVNYSMGLPSLSSLSQKSIFYTEGGSDMPGLKAEYLELMT